MIPLTFGSLFAGIGGFDAGLERAGMVCKWQVEIDPFCQKVLAKHWPDVERFSDVRECGKYNLEPVGVICGGFPCQDVSKANAGGNGLDGARSGLWSEFARIVGELRPRYVVVENTANLLNRGVDVVLGDLASCGYDAEWEIIPACAFGAPHARERLFIVAYTNQQRPQGGRPERNGRNDEMGSRGPLGQNNLRSPAFAGGGQGGAHWHSESGLGRMVNGPSSKLDRNRLRVIGNAVVPQVAEWIGHCIMETERAQA